MGDREHSGGGQAFPKHQLLPREWKCSGIGSRYLPASVVWLQKNLNGVTPERKDKGLIASLLQENFWDPHQGFFWSASSFVVSY